MNRSDHHVLESDCIECVLLRDAHMSPARSLVRTPCDIRNSKLSLLSVMLVCVCWVRQTAYCNIIRIATIPNWGPIFVIKSSFVVRMCAKLSWSHSAFEFTLNSSIVQYSYRFVSIFFFIVRISLGATLSFAPRPLARPSRASDFLEITSVTH